MRVALAVFGLTVLLGLGGCCGKWQPNCCNNWDWYDPCDLIEGREARDCNDRGCHPRDCAPGVIVLPTRTDCAPGAAEAADGSKTIIIMESGEANEAAEVHEAPKK